MKTFVGIALLCSSIMFICQNVFELYKRNTKSDVTVIQINSNWNIKNSLDLSKLNGCDASNISCIDTDSKKRIFLKKRLVFSIQVSKIRLLTHDL